jgi:hypothetical protein
MPPPQGQIKYSIKIVELQGNQSPNEGITKNISFFTKDGLTSSQFAYSTGNPKLQINKRYAWQISFNEMKSDAFSFKIGGGEKSSPFISIDSIAIVCDNDSVNVYKYIAKVKNMSTGSSPTEDFNLVDFTIFTAPQNITTVPNYVRPQLPSGMNIINNQIYPQNNIQPGQTVTLTGTIYGTSSLNFTFLAIARKSQLIQQNDWANDTKNQNLFICSCCEGFVRKIDSLGVSSSSGTTTLSAFLTAGPKPIIKVVAELVYFSYIPDGFNGNSDNACRRCVWGSEQFGNFGFASNLAGMPGVLTTNPSLPYTYSREVIWQSPTVDGVSMSAGSPVNLSLLLPNANSLVACCQDTIKLCVRLSFTDISCVTCDTVICGQFVRKGNEILGMGEMNNMFEDFYGNKNEAGGFINAEDKILNEKIYPKSIDKINSFDKYDINRQQKKMDISSMSNTWYFGNKACIRWVGGVPISDKSGPLITDEGCSVLADALGNPLFFTDGVHLYKQGSPPTEAFLNNTTSHQHMSGNSSTTQSAIMLMFDDNKFAVVSPDLTSEGTNNTGRGIYYYLFNPDGQTLSGGGILPKQLMNNPDSTTERITAVLNEAGTGYWIIAHGYESSISSNYYAFQVNKSDGTLDSDVPEKISYNGLLNHSGQGGGYLRASPDCKTLACPVGSQIEITSFNRSTGNITPKIRLNKGAYGVEFSPDGHYLYIAVGNAGIFRYNLLAGTDESEINASRETIIDDGKNYRALSVGPDGNIYVAIVNSTQLGIISEPNRDSPKPTISYLNLFNNADGLTTSKYGLPNFSQCINPPSDPDTLSSICCELVTTNVQSDLVINNNRLYVKSKIFTRPYRITQVRADLVNFYMNKQDDCERCVNSNMDFGSIIPVSGLATLNIGNTRINWNGPSLYPSITRPSSTPFNSASSYRELVWNLNGTSRPPLGNSITSGEKVALELKVPPRVYLTCCPDTINFCIRWSFTDTTCQTCDTLICYSYIRPGITGQGTIPLQEIQGMEKEDIEIQKDIEKELKDLEKIKNEMKGKKVGLIKQSESENLYTQLQNQSAGVINFDVLRNSKVKLILYDVNGKELFNVYDSDLGEGKYSVDLSAYNIPDGVYYYKIKNGDAIETKKVLVINQQSSCNCGKK